MLDMYVIKKGTLEAVLEAARNTYPHEFFAMLGGDKGRKIIDEFVVVPAVYGKSHALVKAYLIPFDSRILGSVHSHPSPACSPSDADIGSFAKMGEIHLIISYPFRLENARAFNSRGTEEKIRIT